MASFTLASIVQQLPKAQRTRLSREISLLEQQITMLDGCFSSPPSHEEFLDACADIEEFRGLFHKEREVTLAWEANAQKWKGRYHKLKDLYFNLQEEVTRLKEGTGPSPTAKCTCRVCALHKRLGFTYGLLSCAVCRVRPCHQSEERKKARKERYKEIGKKGGIRKHQKRSDVL